MSQVRLHEGDNRDSLRRLIAEGVRVHSVVTDPPYGLTSVTKRFGAENAAPAKFGTDGAFARASGGFMGRKWDGTGIERDPEFWRLVHDVLLPGGYCLAFSGARTGHWQACAMEQAGFIMHPMLGWVYGQGFPKDHDAAMAIDKILGRPGHKAPQGEPVRRLRPGADQNRDADWEKLQDRFYQPGVYVPGTSERERWNGWAYGGQTLKPALEPIYLAQRPFSEKNGALNLLKHGVGALNVEGCRAGDRHPANLLHDGSPAALACFPAAPGQIARSSSSRERRADQTVYGEMRRGGEFERAPRADAGSAARFFNSLGDPLPIEDVIDGLASPLMYQGKATTADRVFSCSACGRRSEAARPACGCVGPDGKAARVDSHPTVKPVALMRWLCRLITPPGGTVLDPFAGSGTTAVAALAEGFRPVLMEAEPEYVAALRWRFDIAPTFASDILDLLGDVVPPDDVQALL